MVSRLLWSTWLILQRHWKDLQAVSGSTVDVTQVLLLSHCVADACKYFGCELGAQTQMDAKNERYIVNGAHEGERLQDLLDGFIKKFVLCPDCENPETVLVRVNV